ncbi:MAG: hypothetical protein ACE5EX_09080, partial [Phycisphaerae bacterium]
ELDLPDIRNSLRSVMWRNVGIVRNGERLTESCNILDFWAHYTLDKTFDHPAGWEVQNMITVARQIAASALQRDVSVGVHFRSDAPDDTGIDQPAYRLEIRRTKDGAAPRRVPLSQVASRGPCRSSDVG